MKAAEHKSASISTIQKKSNTPFFDTEHASEQESPFFAPQEASGTDAFFQPATRPIIQTKLTVGQPNDKYEQEADTVADKVVQRLAKTDTADTPTNPKSEIQIPKSNAPEEEKLDRKEDNKEELPELQKSPVSAIGDDEGLQMKCAECEAEEDSGHVQMKGNTEGIASSNIESQLNSSKGGGSPLPDNTRTSMESAMGADFSNVRVHTGSNAVQMSQDLNAQAFTHGSDVYFNEGKYNPSGTEGGRLLAHELTHTVQQGGAKTHSTILFSNNSTDNIQRNPVASQNIFLNTVDWIQDDQDTIISFQSNNDRIYFTSGAGIVYRVPNPQRPEVRNVFGVGATSASGSAVVTTGQGRAIMFDAGSNRGTTLAVYLNQINNLMSRMGATNITNLEISHAHLDHTNRMEETVRRWNISAENVIIADFQAPWARNLQQQWERLAGSSQGQLLGYARIRPGTGIYRISPNAQYYRVRFQRGDLVIEYRAQAALVNALASRPVTGNAPPSLLIDAASNLVSLRQSGTDFRMIMVGDLRGSDIEALYNSMERVSSGSFGAIFNGVEVVAGMQHHLGVVRNSNDVTGIRILLEHTALSTGRLEAIVQTDNTQMQTRLVEALNHLGVNVSVTLEGNLTPSNVTVNNLNQITITGNNAQRFESSPEARSLVQRISEIRSMQRVFSQYKTHLGGFGASAGSAERIEQEFNQARNELELLYRNRIEMTIGRLSGLNRSQANQVSFNNTNLQANAEAIRQERPIDRTLRQNDLKEALLEIIRGEIHYAEIEKEMSRVVRSGEASVRLFELIRMVAPEYAREILSRYGTDTARARRNTIRALLQQIRTQQVVETSGGGAVGFRGRLTGSFLLGLEVANIVLPIIEQERVQRQGKRFDAYRTLVWWYSKGVLPTVKGLIDRWFSPDEIIEDVNDIMQKLQNKELDALILDPITNENQWGLFGIWVTANILNFDDYFEEFENVAVKTVRWTGSPEARNWQMRVWRWNDSITQGMYDEWVDSPQLTIIMHRTFERMVQGTESNIEQIRQHRQPVNPTSNSEFRAVPENTQDYLRDYIPTGAWQFKRDASDKNLYSIYGEKIILSKSEWWDQFSQPIFFTLSYQAPEGFVTVIGADYNTYAAIRSVRQFVRDSRRRVEIREDLRPWEDRIFSSPPRTSEEQAALDAVTRGQAEFDNSDSTTTIRGHVYFPGYISNTQAIGFIKLESLNPANSNNNTNTGSNVSGNVQRNSKSTSVELEENSPTVQKKEIFNLEIVQMKFNYGVEEKEETLQRKASNTEGVASSDTESQLNRSKGGGSPLPDETRTFMESAMGADFSNVRVHTGSNAVQMSQDLNAQAFTHGSDVYFNEGKYNSENTGGVRLLAHELTHTVQQSNTSTIQRNDDESNSNTDNNTSVNYSTYSYRELKNEFISLEAQTADICDPIQEENKENISLEIEQRLINVQNEFLSFYHPNWASLSYDEIFEKRLMLEDISSTPIVAIPIQLDLLKIAQGLAAIEMELFRRRKEANKPASFMYCFDTSDWTFLEIFEEMNNAGFWLEVFANNAEKQELKSIYINLRNQLKNTIDGHLRPELVGNKLKEEDPLIKSLADEELIKAIFTLETYVAEPELLQNYPASEYNFWGWGFPTILSNNLRLLHFERTQRTLPYSRHEEGLISDPATAEDLALDPAGIRYQIQTMYEQDYFEGALPDGWEAADIRWQSIDTRIKKLEEEISNGKYPIGADPIWLKSELRKQYVFLSQEREAFLTEFEEAGRMAVLDIMNASEARLNAERIKYGLSEIYTTEMEKHYYEVQDEGMSAKPTSGIRTIEVPKTVLKGYSLTNEIEAGGLANAAGVLAEEREKIKPFEEKKDSLTKKLYSPLAPNPLGGLDSLDFILNPEKIENIVQELEIVNQELSEKEEAYTALRTEIEKDYPALGTWASKKDLSKLKTLQKAVPDEVATIIGHDIAKKLANIIKVRVEIVPGGDISIWKLDEIFNLTKQVKNVPPNSIYEYWANDKREKVIEDDEFWDTFLTVLSIGLGVLAAIPTGGSSLAVGVSVAAGIGALAIDTHMAIEHYQDYELKKAMRDTDFDPARVISQEDPSLFWLAVDIIGIGLSVGDVAKAFKGTTKGLTKSSSEAANAFDSLKKPAHDFIDTPSEDNMLKLLDDAAKISPKLEKSLRRRAEALLHVRGIAKAKDEIAQGLIQKEGVVYKIRKMIDGHELTVTSTGYIVRCSNPCTTLRAFYSDVLDDPDLLKELEVLETELKTGAGKNVEEIAEKAETLELKLRKARGTKSFTKPMKDIEATSLEVDRMADILEDSFEDELIRREKLGVLYAIRGISDPYVAKRELKTLYEDLKRFQGGDNMGLSRGVDPSYDDIDKQLFEHGFTDTSDKLTGSPPIESGIKGDIGEHSHAIEMFDELPPLTAKYMPYAKRMQLMEDLLSGKITLKDLLAKFPQQGIRQFMFNTMSGRRYIDHIFIRDGEVILRESKNVSVFHITDEYWLQIKKDFQIATAFPNTKIEWRISGKIDDGAKSILDNLVAQSNGKFNYISDDVISSGGIQDIKQRNVSNNLNTNTHSVNPISNPTSSSSKPRIFDNSSTKGESALPPGNGYTDKFGNITYSTQGTKKDQELVLFHEQVHSFLSPKLRVLRTWRADLAMEAYNRSHLIKYIEEALAETYAQVKVNGFSQILTGIKFPIKNGYVKLSRVVGETAIGVVVYGSIVYGVYVFSN